MKNTKYVCKHCKDCIFWSKELQCCDIGLDTIGIVEWAINNGCTAIKLKKGGEHNDH